MENFPEYFLALCKDRPTDPNGFVFSMYFVNNSEEAARELNVKTGGYVTVDDELINLKPFEKSFKHIEPQSFQMIETDDEATFDFVIWYQLTVKTLSRSETLDFDIPKYLIHAEKVPRIPILEKEGYVFFPV